MANTYYTLFTVRHFFVISPLFCLCSRIVYSKLYEFGAQEKVRNTYGTQYGVKNGMMPKLLNKTGKDGTEWAGCTGDSA